MWKFISERLILSEENFKGFFFMKKNLTVAADTKEMLSLPDSVESKKSSI